MPSLSHGEPNFQLERTVMDNVPLYERWFAAAQSGR